MARHKNSNYDITEGLNFGQINEHEVQEVQKVQEVFTIKQEPKEIGSTQGRKGQKLKRINMAFSDANHEYITKESRRQGISSTAFVNLIIDAHRRNN